MCPFPSGDDVERGGIIMNDSSELFTGVACLLKMRWDICDEAVLISTTIDTIECVQRS